MADDDSIDPAEAKAEADGGIGARPADDALALAVARARIAGALFASEARVCVGRYQLLQRAGAGGMGVVWSAWDPELERRVAIKLMHVKSEAARAAMLREGQALARLSHPNIVPIYDVGTLDDQVYLVMEWISGETLRAHSAQPRTARELIACLLAAGAGVAAAHRAGIVQRDFKPENVMVGGDGRVRLLDFGLARPEHADGAAAGTPRYMAPEQAAGAPATPAADQYSFGIALDELVGARRDRPAMIPAIVARATAKDPRARYPDMPALLAALAYDRARVWRRRGVALALIASAASAFAIGQARNGLAEVCDGDEDVRATTRTLALARHVASLGPYGAAQSSALAGELAMHGATWRTARRAACVAHQRGAITPALYERELACLERARAALDGVTTTLLDASRDRLPDAIVAARDLPDAARCRAVALSDGVPPPRPGLAASVAALGAAVTRARYLALAADPAAAPLARATAGAAASLGYAPLTAQAQLALGAALEAEPSPAPLEAYRAAADAALAGGDDIAFVEAFARRLYVAARRRDEATPSLVAALPIATAIAARTGDAGRFARALLYNNAASERLAAGEPAAAIALLRLARVAAPVERGAELGAILGNLAMLVPARAERDALFAEERAQLARTIGADHPFALQLALRAAMFVEHRGEAAVQLRAICARYRQLHPELRDKIASCHAELAWLAVERGDVDEATRAHAIVAADPGRNAARGTLARGELRRLAGDPRGALALVEPIARARTDAWWERLAAADAWLSAAAARAALEDPAASVRALRAARALLDDVQRHTQATAAQRRGARVTALLAQATRDRALADEARAWYVAAGGYDAALPALSW